jgi:dolichyl-phosphate-mannose--protein O-mannosyl transferase
MFRKAVDMMVYNAWASFTRSATATYASVWWTWPLALGRWSALWWRDGVQHIIILGNVMTWWPVFAGIVGGIAQCTRARDASSIQAGLVLGYVLSLLPFAFVRTKDVDLSAYAVPLLLGIMNLVSLMETHLRGEVRGFVFALIIAVAIGGFLLWSPWVYGMTTPDFGFLVWNSKWPSVSEESDVGMR